MQTQAHKSAMFTPVAQIDQFTHILWQWYEEQKDEYPLDADEDAEQVASDETNGLVELENAHHPCQAHQYDQRDRNLHPMPE